MIKLIEDWKKSWRMHSIRFAAAIPVLATVRENIDYVKNLIPDNIFPIVVGLLGVAVVIGRITKQDSVSGPDVK